MMVVFDVWAVRKRGTAAERKRISSVMGPWTGQNTGDKKAKGRDELRPCCGNLSNH
jgi:hypothetical protein